MKRTRLTRKTPLRVDPDKVKAWKAKSRKPISRVPKSPLKKAKAEAWTTFSRYIRLRDALRTTGTTTSCLCVTCGREKPIFVRGGIEAGHFIPGRHNSVLFDERGVHGQCHYCNNHLKGAWVPYYAFMLKTYGQGVINELIERDKQQAKWTVDEYEAMTAELQGKIDAMLDGNHVDASREA